MPDFCKADAAFSSIYDNRHWGEGSGIGSAPTHVASYLALLSNFMRDNGVRSVVDLGCGDWQFSRLIDWTGIDYRGFDVVDRVVAENQVRFGGDNVSFAKITSLDDLPSADLVVCKDVLQHLPLLDVQEFLAFFRSSYGFSFVTNDVFPDQWTNTDIPHGGARAIRLDLAPFSLIAPVLLRWEVNDGGQKWIKTTNLLVSEREV